MQKRIKYKLPFPNTAKKKIAHPKGKYAHENFLETKYAIDFPLNTNTPIFAARGGVVVEIKDDSDKCGLDISLAGDVNFVEIDHDDGTYAEYLHLGKNKAVVKKGQKVKSGDLLGYTGWSGVMDVPHLHFNVFKIENENAVSIPVEFE